MGNPITPDMISAPPRRRTSFAEMKARFAGRSEDPLGQLSHLICHRAAFSGMEAFQQLLIMGGCITRIREESGREGSEAAVRATFTELQYSGRLFFQWSPLSPTFERITESVRIAYVPS